MPEIDNYTLRPSDIVTHLWQYLPYHTILFSTLLDIDSAEVIFADVVNAETATPHGLVPGSVVVVVAGRLQNSIIGVELLQDDTIARFTTGAEHDFTAPISVNDLKTFSFFGFDDPAWNGTHDITNIPNRLTIETNVPDGATIPVVLSGGEGVYEDRHVGINGVWPVETTPSDTQFTLRVSGVPDLPINPIEGLTIQPRARIAAAADFARAEAAYTKDSSGLPWLYVVMGDVDISKDRHSLNDADATFLDQDVAKLLLLQNFSTVAFFDTTTSLTGATVQETIYGELYTALISTLYGMRKPTRLSSFRAISRGHGATVYNSAYYAQSFDWQLPQYITWEVGFVPPDDVAMRNIDYTLLPFDADNPDGLELRLNLDEEPIS
jgi:hypothetical protein